MGEFQFQRITLERVLSAYEISGLTPMFRNFIDYERLCGCALSAIASADAGYLRSGAELVCTTNGQINLYHDQFVCGFDDRIRGSDFTSDGYTDGRDARKAVLAAYPGLAMTA